MSSICPQKGDKRYQLLETLLGHGRALGAWVLHGEDKIPTPVQAIELLYPNVHADEAFTTMDFGDIAGRYEPTYEKMIDDKILNHPDQPINEGESFNGFQKRTLERFNELLHTAPDNAAIVTHSSVLKLMNLWDRDGRPDSLRVNNKEYTEAQTHTGDVEQFKSDNGTLWVVRHGETEDNVAGNLRSPHTKLTNKGVRKAENVAKDLSKIEISQLYTSPLDRAIHTSDIIMAAQYKDPEEQQQKLDNVNKQLKHELQTIVSRAISGRFQESNIGKSLFILQGLRGPGTSIKGNEYRMGEVWEKLKESNLDYKEELGDFIDAGGEHNVYRDITPDTVIKERYNLNPVEYDSYFMGLLFHNRIFSSTNYQLLGFKKDEDFIKPILRQKSVIGNGDYLPWIIEDVLKELGFSEIDNDDFAFENKDADIILTDLKPANVPFIDGVPQFIDPLIFIGKSFYNELQQRISRSESKGGRGSNIENAPNITRGFPETTGEAKQRRGGVQEEVWRKEIQGGNSEISRLGKITPPSSPITLYNPSTSITPSPVIHLTAQQHKEMNEAGSRGEIYYMLTPEQSEYIDRLKEQKDTTPIQRALIDGLYLKPTKMDEGSAKVLQETGIQPHERVMLNEATHTYTDTKGIVYHSTTEGINGKFTPEQQEEYKLNREWGIDCDNILQGIVLGKVDNGKLRPLNIEEIETTHLPTDVKMDVYSTLRAFIHEYRQKGYIPLTQVVVASKGDTPEQNRAGSIDLLLISPDGTDNKIIDLKTSIRAAKEVDKLSSTYTSGWAPKEGSVFINAVLDKDNNVVHRPAEKGKVIKEEGDRDIKLSKELQHAIQVGSYAKMLELQGLPVGELNTLHLHLKIVDGKVDSYKNEGLIPHPVDNNRPYIDAIVPKVIDSDQWSELQKKVYGVEDGEPSVEAGPSAAESIEKLDMTLDKFRTEFSKRKASPLPEMRQTSINEIKNLIADIGKLQEKGDIKTAMNMVLDYTSQITSDALKFISKEVNMNHPQFFQYLQESLLIGGSNNTLLPTYLRKYLSDTARARFDNIKSDISELLETAGIKAKEYVIRNIFGTDKVDEGAIAARFPKEGIEDISLTGSYLTNFDSLRSEPIREGQYMAQREIKATDIETTKYQQEWTDIGNDLVRVVGDRIKDKKFWDIFYEHDSNGKKTGYINPTGDKYLDTADHIEDALIDDKGEWKQYIPITDLKTASKEDIAYNVELAHNKEVQTKFREAERLGDNGHVVVGKYHHLSDVYETERAKVMDKVVHTTWEGDPLYLEYVPKPGHINSKGEESIQLKAFRNKYQTRTRYMSALKEKGKYTGAVIEKEGYFPNSTYIIPNDYIDNDVRRESLLNPRWVKLNNPVDDIGRAQLKFYKEFIKRAVWSLNHLEGDDERYIAKLGIVPAQAHFFQTAAKAGMLNSIKFQMAHFFTALHKSDIEHTDPEGVSRRMLRMTQIANLRSQDKVDDIQRKLTELTTRKSSMSKGEYKKQRDELNRQLQIESHKLSADDIDPDMVHQGQMLQIGANTNFHKQSIEGKLLALEWALKQQKVIKTTGLGVPKRDREGNPVFKTEAERNDLRAMNQLMKNFYGISLDETQMGVLINRLQNLTSMSVMGFNFFNGANNTILYQLNNAGHILSSRFGLKASSWPTAQKDFFISYLPGLAKKALEKSTYYGEKRPYSKLEAFMKMYRLSAESNIEMETAGKRNKVTKYAYMFEGFAIDAGKVVLTDACWNSFDLMNRDTGTMVPWKEAYQYDPNTGSLTLKAGYNPDDILHLLVKLEDIQTKAQGNYQAISQPAMVGTYLGKMLAQFHRFFPTSANNAVSRKFEHKTLGTQEGTWRSALGMVNVIREWDGSFYDPFNPFDKESREKFWESVPQHMKENLVYDGVQLVQLGILIALGAAIKGVAEDISTEDPTQKRWMNWLAYTASRLRFEQQTFIPVLGTLQIAELAQNPIPLQQTLRNLAEAVYLSAEYPFQADDERNYKNGIFVGKSKAGHMWHKSIPISREYDQWMNRLRSQDYEGSLLGSNK